MFSRRQNLRRRQKNLISLDSLVHQQCGLQSALQRECIPPSDISDMHHLHKDLLLVLQIILI